MVEGPGATRNGRKVQVAVGKSFVATPRAPDIGSIHEEVNASNETAPPTLPHHLAGELASHKLEDAFTVGKELFFIFTLGASVTEVALRLHFGMNGSLNARKVKSSDLRKRPSGVAPWKQKNEPSLRLYFIDESRSGFGGASNYVIVEAWDTTVTFPVSVQNSRNKLMDLTSRDACSTLFNAQDVFTAIRQSGNNLIISDALLNQDIFPGVGNIIKIESLHKSKIDPRKIVSSLTDAELRRIIRHSRKYSMDWLKSGRAGNKLVYNQTVCGTCQGMTVKMQKIGGSSSDGNNNVSGKGHAFMSRVTFWCTVCQPRNASGEDDGLLKIPSDPSNLGNMIGEGNSSSKAAKTTDRPTAQCPQHGLKSLKLCRVRKGNQNTLRIFFTCKLKGCQYFAWADNQFSNCRCGKKAVLRVSKTERSGGKWFLCCALGDKSMKSNIPNGCGHFEW
eukprot:CAMPEP_0172325546 /NCGR_PEP_ID=MMETSP1058-20130122/54332_1 /TAXON_ID=83371 /ORGANISM="Detonula confervacea, Strain CCMP 353" /LENGTH=446 /DNA_ID=CAMNT_0013042125 /DNA_START=47 /DNA_END=1384 /DNA_ORIENTATION=-